MEKFPTELLEKIFLLLRRPDRLRAALVCQRWAEIVSASRFLRDICVVLRGADLESATPVLLDSRRQYSNLKICDGMLMGFHAAFWTRIAGDLVSLQLENCDILDAGVFYAILEGCQKLQSLEITDCVRGANVGRLESKYLGRTCVAKVQQSLRNVRHLSLRRNQGLTDASVNQMLTLMPNIKSLCLAGCSNLKFHPGIFRSFHTDNIEFSSNELTFQNVLVCMLRSKQDFVDLDFSETLITDEALFQIVELYRESLTNLRLDSCKLTEEAFYTIEECSKLRLLSLQCSSEINDDNLACILTNTPDLEYLDLNYSYGISSQSLQRIVKLEKLRHLNLNGCQRIDSNTLGSLRALTELQHLDLGDTKCDVKALRQLATLKDLRVLKLCQCSKLDSECFVIICDNFKRLEKLDLAFSSELTNDGACRFHQLKNLRSLDITAAERITDRSFDNGIGASDMEMLEIGSCSLLTDSALLSIAKHHVCLEYLDLTSCYGITDVGLISAVRCLPRLRVLKLDFCRSLTDRSLHALQDNCPHLRKLDVIRCSMSCDAIDSLARLRPSLSLTWWRLPQYFSGC